MGDDSITRQSVLQLAEQIGFQTYINELSNGLYTQIDPIGKRFSQKVRKDILIMRSLIGNSRLLLLEGPCSHRSGKEIKMFIEFLRNKKQNATIIITTEHEVMKHLFDMFIVLQNGEIVLNEVK
jgi:ABC-type multidrug transport system fused ATPase/permease subunit